MSLVTRCPACATLFQVRPEQLRAAQGWVRCGQCGEMFVAATQSLPAEGLGDRPAPGAASPVGDGDRAAALMASLPDLELTAPDEDAAWSLDAVPALATPGRIETTVDGPMERPAAPPAPEHLPESVPPARAAAARGSGLPVESDTEPPFLAPALRGAGRRRGLLVLVVALLALLLAGQIAIAGRDTLAARWPALTPVLEAICRPLACRVGPWRQADAVVIEASDFQRLQADRFRLGVTLHNRTERPVAMPAIELTLTDAQGQPLARRVLDAQELDAAALPARAEFELARELLVAAPVDAAAVAGHKLRLLHP